MWVICLFLVSNFAVWHESIGETKVILGVKTIRMGDSILLSRNTQVGHFEAKLMSTPYDAKTHLMKNGGDLVSQYEYE